MGARCTCGRPLEEPEPEVNVEELIQEIKDMLPNYGRADRLNGREDVFEALRELFG